MSWYDRIMGQTPMGMPQQQQPVPMGIPFANPMQRMSAMMQAMRNPAAFVKQNIPDLPDDIANNPDQILNYLQQTRGISNQQIQQMARQNPYPGRF